MVRDTPARVTDSVTPCLTWISLTVRCRFQLMITNSNHSSTNLSPSPTTQHSLYCSHTWSFSWISKSLQENNKLTCNCSKTEPPLHVVSHMKDTSSPTSSCNIPVKDNSMHKSHNKENSKNSPLMLMEISTLVNSHWH